MTVITMAPVFKDEVLDGSRTTITRTGHRDFKPGPATIDFEDGDPVRIQITDVEYGHVRDLSEGYRIGLRLLYPNLNDDEERTKVTFFVDYGPV